MGSMSMLHGAELCGSTVGGKHVMSHTMPAWVVQANVFSMTLLDLCPNDAKFCR